MSGVAVRPAWTSKRFGRLKVMGMIQRPGSDAWYLCRCDCGQNLRCSYGELESGLRTGCDKCGPAPESLPATKAAPWTFTATVNSSLQMQLMIMKDELPGWWWRSLNVIVDEMTQMLGRNTYTDIEIAKWFECPVKAVDAVRKAYKKRIGQINKEYLEVQEQFKDLQKIPSEMICERDVVTLLTAALTSKCARARYKGRSNLYGD